ncbi:MAG TPA: hypothetical protein VJ307_04520, partial [Candidatus Deferrimicrobiaceae bacterium]|nr:hypothetical protein [Candidatus Deferrimicrobiaceae bacterium]
AAPPPTTVALTDVTVTLLKRKDLLDLLSSHPSFSRNFTKMLSTRLLRKGGHSYIELYVEECPPPS